MADAREWYTVTEEDSSVDTTIIKITTDPYKDVTYSYDTVGLSEVADAAKLKFTYNIIDCPSTIDISQTKEDFELLLGDILVSIICEKENELRNNDPIPSD
jgi:hypothetical protein